jgi:hypothetical protein
MLPSRASSMPVPELSPTPTCSATTAWTQKITLDAGTYAAVQLDSRSRIVATITRTVRHRSTVPVGRTREIAGTSRLEVCAGMFRGYWLKEASAGLAAARSKATPASPPTATPRPAVAPRSTATPSPTPTPTSTPSTGRQTWRILALVYPAADLTYTPADGTPRHFASSMTARELSTVSSILGTMPGTVTSWSGGVVRVTVTMHQVPRPLASVTSYLGQFWVSPDDVRADIDTYAPRGSYDSVLVVWKSWNESGAAVPILGWGMSLMPGDWANGAGYSTVYLPPASWWWNGTYPSEVFIHEWLHEAVHFYRAFGYPSIPSADAASTYGYTTDSAGSWRTWLSALMTGTIVDGSGNRLGIPASVWALGRPSGT